MCALWVNELLIKTTLSIDERHYIGNEGKTKWLRPWQCRTIREDWSSYAERIQQYFKAYDVADDDKKRAILLSNSGPQTYQLDKNPLAPTKPTKNTFTDIVAVLKKHWRPKPSEIVQQYNLRSRLQKEGQSIADYVAELDQLLEHCGFKENTLDDMLRDRLVCRVKNTCTWKKLLAESDLTFKKAYRTVQAVEAAEQQLKELQDKDKAGHPVHRVQEKKSTDLTQGNCYQCGGSRQLLRVLFQGSIMYRVCGKTGHSLSLLDKKWQATKDR